MELKSRNQQYVTHDRYEIYVLLASDCVVHAYECDQGVVSFHFKDRDKCQKIIAQFLSKKLKLHAHQMIEAIRTAHSIFNNAK